MMPEYADLAPQILRQRLVVEGYPARAITETEIKDYLSQLSSITRMIRLLEPVTHKSDLYGWAGWIHWETSGAHFYAWEKPLLFFSVDIYTCKQFDPELVVNFTRDYFQASNITAKDFSSSSSSSSSPTAILEPATSVGETATATRKPTAIATKLGVSSVARYTLSDVDLDRLSRRLLAEQPPKVRDALIVYRLDGTDELSNLARHIEREVFEESFGNDDGQMHQIYGLYEDVSIFFLAVDQRARRPVGALRAIRAHATLGLLTLREAEKYHGVTAEQFRKHHGLRGRASRGMRHYILIVDAGLHRTFDMLGYPFAPLAGTPAFRYEGSESSAMLYGRPAGFFAAMERKLRRAETTADPRMRAVLTAWVARFVHGVGIDHRFMFDFAVWPGGSSPVPLGERVGGGAAKAKL
ncbi:uncharacterized protein PG998_012701 [Apiospora kogelbergensis]|uniref:uncharacterized protein n=1 Tax=Apiospora kogelbergensis TaxID=1337665 RepID=UPI00313238F9